MRCFKGLAWGRRLVEQFGLMALQRPRHIKRIHTVQDQRTRGLTPALKISFAVEGDEMHQFPFVIAI